MANLRHFVDNIRKILDFFPSSYVGLQTSPAMVRPFGLVLCSYGEEKFWRKKAGRRAEICLVITDITKQSIFINWYKHVGQQRCIF